MTVHPRMTEMFRAQAAVAALQGLLAAGPLNVQDSVEFQAAGLAGAAVKLADALAVELKKPRPTEVPS